MLEHKGCCGGARWGMPGFQKLSDDQARLQVGKRKYTTHDEAEIDVRIICTNFDN
jgi:hypothetical protein